VLLDGAAWQVLVECDPAAAADAAGRLADGQTLGDVSRRERDGLVLLCSKRRSAFPAGAKASLAAASGVRRVWVAEPLTFVKCGRQIFSSAQEMAAWAGARGLPAGGAALAYESELLALPETAVVEEMLRRFEVMRAAVREGMKPDAPPMQLLRPTAGAIYTAEAEGTLALGGPLTRAAARALAAMHVNCAMGVVCAAPTAGSAGVIPAVAVTLHEELGVAPERIARCLLAAGVIGVIVAERATFAAEVAGCQVEIGAAGAMAAAAVVEAAGGSLRQAADAAAVSFQNTMGSVCDLVQGIVEIPCHTRNAVAAASAFIVADLVLGGYENPIPLDETIDAVYSVGRMLPAELRVTALGGLALAPSAQRMPRIR
jgi:L-serine dehydratase